MNLENYKDKQLFYIIFQPLDKGIPFWLRWLNKNCGHCFLLEARILYNTLYLLEINVCLKTINADFLSIDNLRKLNSNEKSIKIWWKKEKNNFTGFPILDCVSFIKRYLGIKKPFIFTPKQLYHYLLKIGGEENPNGCFVW